MNASDAAADLLVELVRRVSVTPLDGGCQALLGERLRAAGFDCQSMPFGDVTNLWARIGTGRPLLCFAGHTDVVPPGDPAAWRFDPFAGVVDDGFLYGRGTADMKCGLAAMVVAAERFCRAYPSFDGSLALLLTSDEEGDAVNGTRRVVEALTARGESIDWCVIGEPSSDQQLGDVVRIGRRGSLSGKLLIRGVQGHVAYPQAVDNPVRRFAPALAALHDRHWDDGNKHFPPTSFQVVHLQSSAGAQNVTPASLEAHFNFRYSTRWTHTALQEEVQRILELHGLDYQLSWQLQGEPFLTQPGLLIDAAVGAVLDATGAKPVLSTGGGTSDGRFIAPTGAEVIELGPVNASIHKPDERVRLADVSRLADLYERIMELLLRP